MYGRKRTEAEKEAVSIANKGRKAWNSGKTLDIVPWNKGLKTPRGTPSWNSGKKTGKRTPEQIERIKQAALLRWQLKKQN